ncbi:MAG: TolC family protein [Acidobacteria bacterium]|nr:TolC family protein [Acidobacteriota bacterium]
MRVAAYWTTALVLFAGISANSQEMNGKPTPLATLLAEAQSSNSQIAAANDTWKASSHVARQVSTLPDPQFTFQSFSVGSPKPGAGFSNSNFAYLGFGASQALPFPGKLRLKGEVASRKADTAEAQVGVVSADVGEHIKLLYLRLAYLQQTLTILDHTDGVLGPLVKNALSHYSLGEGSQAGIIKAQLQRTEILRRETVNREQMGEAEADLKELLHRTQDSPDIIAEPLVETTLRLSASELQALVRQQNPVLQVEQRSVQQEDAQIKSEQRGSKPDFNVGYMYQLTGPSYRDYYMLTLNLSLPHRGRVREEVAEATEQANHARHELDSEAQQQLAAVQKQFVAATSTAELLADYNHGLIPQSEAIFRSEESSYEANKQEFTPVLSSLLDLLSLKSDYQEALLEHETAIVRLETLTGASLR